jgi:hypothetical protein
MIKRKQIGKQNIHMYKYGKRRMKTHKIKYQAATVGQIFMKRQRKFGTYEIS